MSENEKNEEQVADHKTGSFKIGAYVLIVLTILVVVEYIAAIHMDRNLPLMIVMNVADAALIMIYFMHIARALRKEH